MSRADQMSKEEALEFLKSIGMKNRRVLKGTEREHMLLIFALIEPTESSNNQRTFTETYHHIGKEYEVTYGFDIEGEPEPYVEEITKLK
jgi:hypothetical protein